MFERQGLSNSSRRAAIIQESTELLPFCRTVRQREVLQALIREGSVTRAAQGLEIKRTTVQSTVAAVRIQAERRGWAPEFGQVHPVPETQAVKGVSTCYNSEGQISQQWVKTDVDQERRLEFLRQVAESYMQDLPQIKPTKTPKSTRKDLLCAMPWGDPHFGSYVWAEECGDDYSLDIAKRLHVAAVEYLVRQSPDSERLVIIPLGDFFHADNLKGVTNKSGNVLDMDTRMPKVIDIGIAALRQCIAVGLQKHKFVDVMVIPGNHDELLSPVLAIMLAHIYEKEPRVIIHRNATKRKYLRHGKVLLGAVHGDTTKDDLLPGIMAAERPEDWGATRYRYFYRGHHHQDKVIEYNGCKVEQVRTLAAADAYAMAGGWMSGRDMKCIVHHAEYGEVSRNICGVDMLRGAI